MKKAVFLLICILPLSNLLTTVAFAELQANSIISSNGAINYQVPIYGFEVDQEFEFGIYGKAEYTIYPDYSIYYDYPALWDRGGYVFKLYRTAFEFEPETNIYHSGDRSAKLSILNPVDDTRRRLEVLNDWRTEPTIRCSTPL